MDKFKVLIQKIVGWHKDLLEKNIVLGHILKILPQYFITYIVYIAVSYVILSFLNYLCLPYKPEFEGQTDYLPIELDNLMEYSILFILCLLSPLLYIILFSRDKISTHPYFVGILQLIFIGLLDFKSIDVTFLIYVFLSISIILFFQFLILKDIESINNNKLHKK